MGPEGFQERWSICAPRSASTEGLGEVRLREDAGISLGHPAGAAGRGPQQSLRRHQGEKAWQEVPGEYRAMLRRLLVIQGDTEPASVEQQRHPRRHRAVALRPAQPVPGQCRGRPPSLGDGLSAAEIFRPRRPRGSRGSAAPPLRRPDSPRMLGAFNEATPDWLSFFMFTYFTDRDGKMQLGAWRSPASIRCRAPAASC